MSLAKNHRGFTLVELSITLVIIGLLIAGLLVAQSIIDSAKINRTVGQIQQFDAAVATFKSRYKYLPGDAPFAGGNGNGVLSIQSIYSNTTESTCMGGETSYFWYNLSPVEYPGRTTDWPIVVPPVRSGAGQNVPESKMGKAGSFFIVSGLSTDGSNVDTTNKKNYYAIMGPTQGQALTFGQYYYLSTNSSNSAVTPADALAFDQKADDSVANTGTIVSGSIPNNSGVGIGAIWATPATGICSSGATYTVANPAFECTPLIRMGGQTGELF